MTIRPDSGFYQTLVRPSQQKFESRFKYLANSNSNNYSNEKRKALNCELRALDSMKTSGFD